MNEDVQYNAIVEWRNAFGELNAAEYPKLAFYGALAIVYALIGVLWGFLFFQHRQDILPIQVRLCLNSANDSIISRLSSDSWSSR